ncbi:MAG: TrmH family RNA methyltransferase, partial [Thermoanaerobaculia bacterium]|nr:TrmH family RNA methyltransferase [Thermoanaerobaculia bacterium]
MRIMTPERFRRIRAILDRRQPDLTVLLENVHKPHNFAAVARTCDAVGILDAHAVYPDGRIPRRLAAGAGAERWLELHAHPDVATAVRRLRAEGLRLVAAHPAPDAVDFREVDFTRPTALLLGQEKDGLSDEALAAADQVVAIPMLGAGLSLNVSVAAALVL